MTSAEKDVQLVVEAMFHHGFKIGGYEKDLLQNSIKKRIKSTHTKSTSGYAQLLANNQKEGLLLFESLSIHYSKFFRNSFTCSVLEHIIIPKVPNFVSTTLI